MPFTSNYTIQLPTIGADGDNWGNILNNTTFNSFDSLLYGVQNSNIGNNPPTVFAVGTIWVDNTAATWPYQIYDGSNWVLIGTIDPTTHTFNPANAYTQNVVTFTISGTYTPSANLVYAVMECVGGGGGGSSGFLIPAGFGIGSGGGAGSYAKLTATAATIGASQVITIGAGGAGGLAVNSSGPNLGSNGGVTSVGSLLTTNGGLAPTLFNDAGSRFFTTLPGAGGAVTTGDLVIAGGNANGGYIVQAPSINDFVILMTSGNGGASVYGGAGIGNIAQYNTATPGNSAVANSGSGGSGGSFGDNQAGSLGGQAGGNGSAGKVIITEFLA